MTDPDASGEKCPKCDGTGYAVNCTRVDRERGDLWACGDCDGTGVDTSRVIPHDPAVGVAPSRRE